MSQIEIKNSDFAVEKVIDSLVDKNGTRYYQVKWFDTWVKENLLLSKYQILVDQYWIRQSTEKKPITDSSMTSSLTEDNSVIVKDTDGTQSFTSGYQLVRSSEAFLHDVNHASKINVPLETKSTLPSVFLFEKQVPFRHSSNEPAVSFEKTQKVNFDDTRADYSSISGKRFTCDVCGKKLSSKKTLKRHMILKHLKNGQHQCQICTKRFFSNHELKRHMPVHTNIKQYSCQFCSKAFKQAGQLYKHEQIHTGVKRFSCDLCDKKFTQKINLQNHQSTHAASQDFECSICMAKFKHKNSVYMHFKRSHSGVRDIVCTKCDAGFQTKTLLRNHLREVHNSILFSCQLCTKTFMLKKYMDKHLEKHHSNLQNVSSMSSKNLKNFDKFSAQKGSLKSRTVRSRNDNRKKSFRTNKCVIRQPDHHQEMYLKCNACNAAFLHLDHLKLHMNIHGAIYFHLPCKFCNKSFDLKQSLLHHLQFSHRPVIETALEDLSVRNKNGESSCTLNDVLEEFVDVYSSVINSCPSKKSEFECDLCEASFSRKQYLDFHQIVHSTKFYTCVKCNKKFKWLSSLAKHLEKSHKHQQRESWQDRFLQGLSEEPRQLPLSNCSALVCQLCEAVFNDEFDLNEHENLHRSIIGKFDLQTYLDEDEFLCSLCKENCFHWEELQIHEEIHHNRGLAPNDRDAAHQPSEKDCQISTSDKSIVSSKFSSEQEFPYDMTIFMANKMNELLEVVKEKNLKSFDSKTNTHHECLTSIGFTDKIQYSTAQT